MADAPKKGPRAGRPAKAASATGVKAAGVRATPPKPVTPRPAAAEPQTTAKVVKKPAPARVSKPKAVVPAPAVVKPEAVVALPAVIEPVEPVAPVVSNEVSGEATIDTVDIAPVTVPVTAEVLPEPEVIAEMSGGIEAPKIEETVIEEPAQETEPEAVAAPAQGKSAMSDVLATGKQFAEDAKAKFESAFAEINEKAKAGVEKSTKAIEEFSDITKGNVEAFVESGKIAAKGLETIGQDAAEYSRKNFEKATATLKSFASVKTPAEFFQLQSELLSSSFDIFAKETAKNSEAMLKLAGDVAQPISTRVSVVTEKVKALAA